MSEIGFISPPEASEEAQRLFAGDVAVVGYVMNLSKLWAHLPSVHDGLSDLIRETASAHGLTVRQRGILIAAFASTYGDSYCSLAWGKKLSEVSDQQTAAGVLRGADEGLTSSEAALAAWARKVARDPNQTTQADVQALREGGYSDAEIFGITVFVALRMAFSTVNDALGARPDAVLGSTVPASVLEAVTYGRPVEDQTAAS
ncbi:MAG: carboxymuconolactone decarboxylase family protein [Geodermatophilaceae bacterium]